MYRSNRRITCTAAALVAALSLGPVHQAEAQFLARFANPKIEVTMTHPPGYPLTLDRAAVVPQGEGCPDELADAVISMFSSHGVELLDRQNFEAILAEQDMGVSGLVNPETAVQMGKMVGSAVLVTVTASRCAEESRRHTERFETFDGKVGTRYIAETEGHLKGSVRVIDLATGRIFAARPIQGRSKLANTSLQGPPQAPSTFDARDLALRSAVAEVRKMFFAWDERRELYFFNDDECDLRSAFKMLQIDDVEEAAELSERNLETCRSASVKPKFLARAYYNLGMARLLQSRYDDAIELLTEAFRRDGGDIVAESIAEARRAKSLAEDMARLEEGPEAHSSGPVGGS